MANETPEQEWLSPGEFLLRHKGRIGRNTLYNWLAENKLPHVQINRKILIPSNALSQVLAIQAGGQEGSIRSDS